VRQATSLYGDRAEAGHVGELIRNGLAVLSAGAAGIHFAVIQSHFEEYWLFGVFFAVVAWLQAVWAILVVARPSRTILLSGALVNAVVVAIWIATRTVGIPLGPESGTAEAVTLPDVTATAFEIVLVLGPLALLSSRLHRLVLPRAGILVAPLAISLGVIVLTSAAVIALTPHEGPGHGAPAHEEEQTGGEQGTHQEEQPHDTDAPG